VHHGIYKAAFLHGDIQMKNKKKTILILITALLLASSLVIGQEDVRTSKTKVVDTLAKFPAQNTAERDKLASELIQLGQEGIQEVCRMLVPPGTGDDTRVRFALNALSVYAHRAGAEQERGIYARTLLKALESQKDSEVKAFLIRQLQLVGKNESVKPLRIFLKDKRLCEPATQALLAIRTPEAEKALLKSLRSVSETNRITIIKALGEFRSKAAVKKITRYVSSRNEKLRHVTLYALANIGDPKSEKVLDSISVASSSYERSKAPSLYLLYAQRLAESGKKQQCARICRNLIKNYTSPHESNVPCLALSILVNAIGERAFGDLLSSMENPNKELRSRAIELAGTFQGEYATAQWIKKMTEVPTETQAEIITMLGYRKNISALPTLLQALKSEEKIIRLAAIPALAHLGGSDVLPELFTSLHTDQADEINTTKQVLKRFPSSEVVPGVVEILEEMPPLAQVALIEILSERLAKEHVDTVFTQINSDHESVRLAALAGLENLASETDLPHLIKILLEAQNNTEISLAQNAVVASANLIIDPEKRADLILETLEETTDTKRIDLLRPLAKIGGKNALQTVIEETKTEDPIIQDAAVSTLAEWPDISAVEELFNIYSTTKKQEHRLFAIQGYVRLVIESELTPEKRLSILKEALDIAAEAEEKNHILKGLGSVKILNSLRLVAAYLGDQDLQAQAAITVAEIAVPQPGTARGLFGAEVISVLKKSVGLIEDSYEQERIEKYISAILEQGGFVSLFNGKDLSGWKGLVGDPISRTKMTPEELTKAQEEADLSMREHWKVVDGILVFDGKGESLCTLKDYTDFEMLVDWKIEKGGDSGIYLRGSPQVQIWDPEQWPEGSGGLYNNKEGPSKPLKCVDNPIGEWNTFRIKMTGEKVTVYLNDVLMVDNVVMENYWERDKPIYPTGQIELQSHNSPLYFRNIFIREIIPEKGAQGLTEQETAEGFELLFNGKDLTGWTGDTTGYVAEDGKIVIYPKHGSGNLYTEKEYSDYILRFEFKLTSGANNGLGIRAPLTGDAAYVGMELQILDNTAHIYKDLEPYQYHGSIYGIVPAKRGYLRPVGEWNYEEVIARGRKIIVNLNGVTIVDANIDKASTPTTLDGKDHPGLKREKGHIGFLGHGSHVEFRNIRIKEIK